MSAYLLGMGFKADMGTCVRKLVLLKLIDACEEDGTRIFPAVETIARAAQCSARQAQRELKAFVEAGLLRVVREGGRGPGSTREYAMDLSMLARIADAGWDAACSGAPPDRDAPRGEGERQSTGREAPRGGQGAPPDRDADKSDTVSPLEPGEKGDTGDTERVTPEADKGDTRSHPTPPDPSLDPSGERERAGATDPIPDLDLFERGKRRWPAAIGGNRDRELKVWARLSHHDRVEAERSVEAVVEELKRRKRAHPPGWETYLRNRDWELLPRDRRARPATTVVTRLGREFLALALKLHGEGRPLAPLAEALRRPLEALKWAVDDMPAAEAIAAHTERIRADGPEGFAWRRWLAGQGLDIDAGLGPDLKAGEPRWLWLPARWPPGWDARRAEAAMAAAEAEPKISPETLENMRRLGVDV